MIRIWSHFCFKIDQNLMKNQWKNDIEFKVGFGISIFRFLVDFWPILDQFGFQKWRRRSGWDGSASASQLKLRFKGDLDATWNLSRSILDVGTVFEAILAPKMIQKSTKNQSKIDVCIRLRFLINFWFKIELAKSIKTYWFFNILGYSACYKLS